MSAYEVRNRSALKCREPNREQGKQATSISANEHDRTERWLLGNNKSDFIYRRQNLSLSKQKLWWERELRIKEFPWRQRCLTAASTAQSTVFGYPSDTPTTEEDLANTAPISISLRRREKEKIGGLFKKNVLFQKPENSQDVTHNYACINKQTQGINYTVSYITHGRKVRKRRFHVMNCPDLHVGVENVTNLQCWVLYVTEETLSGEMTDIVN